VYLALFIWAVVYFAESMRGDAKALTKCGLCLGAACLTRYDGWFLAAAMSAVVVLARIIAAKSAGEPSAPARWCPPAAKFVLIAAAAPALWLAYNGIVYRNPLEFENGPYSAKAIERKSQTSGNPGHPGSGNLPLAALYFVKSAEANVAANPWLERLWLLLGLVACIAPGMIRSRTASVSTTSRAFLPLLFLLIPLPFYALSVAYGGVPIFVPDFWPFTHYNVRYGLQLLPAFAVAVGFVVYLLMRSERLVPKLRTSGVIAVLALLLVSYASVWSANPICLEEAQVNMRTRTQLERQLASWLEKLPPDATLLMYVGDHVGALQRAGFPLRHVINEGNHRVWRQPADPEGLWERALANPSQSADYVVAFEGDPVWQAVAPLRLRALVEIHVSGQARAILYRAR